MKSYKLLGLLVVLLLILGCNQNEKSTVTNSDKLQVKQDKSSTQNVAKFIDERLNRIVNYKDSKVIMSSNPYTYIEASKKDYNEIVKLGEPALNYAIRKIRYF